MDFSSGTSAGRFSSLARRELPASCRRWSVGRRTDWGLWNQQPINEPLCSAPVPSRLGPPTTPSVAATSAGAPPLTPRQRRLAQQRRKWEEAQQQQQQQPQQQQQQRTPQPAQQPKRKQRRPPLGAPAKVASSPQVAEEGAAVTEAPAPGAGSATSHHDPWVTAQRADPGSATAAADPEPAPRRVSPTTLHDTSSVAARGDGGSRRSRPGSAAPVASAGSTTPPAPPPAQPQHPPQRTRPHSPAQPSQQEDPGWPSLFGVAAAGPRSVPSLDPHALSTQDLVSLARQWTEELVRWEAADPPRSAAAAAAAASAISGAPSRAGASVAASLHVSGPRDLSQLPAAAGERLARLTKAVDAHVTRGSLGHQELADLAWCVGHYDRAHSLRVLYPALQVPFRVLPRFLPGLRLQDFESEVALSRDTIYLDDGTRAVEESRLTGWQSEIGATFKYSGKEMQPQEGGLSPNVLKVRDALWDLTGVKYDSVLINYYEDGKCGMRYHVDPLYDRWTPNTAVVSLGDTRTFIFRAIRDHSIRWQYRVRNGDVVHMFDDCQERLQHCVRVEQRAEDAGPRMSLVFKERLRGPTGQYLLP